MGGKLRLEKFTESLIRMHPARDRSRISGPATHVFLRDRDGLQDGKDRQSRLQAKCRGRSTRDAGEQRFAAGIQLDQRTRTVARPDVRDRGGKDVQGRDRLGPGGGDHHVLREDAQPDLGS